MKLRHAILLVIAFQWLSRFAGAPVFDFSTDDWTLLQRSEAAASFSKVLSYTFHEPDRPLQAGILSATFRLLGDRPIFYVLLSVMAYSVFIALGARLVYELTTSVNTAMLWGILFACLPNLTESFHWSAMIAVAYMHVAYAGSALMWVLFLKRGSYGRVILSALLYGVAVASYEFGLILPAVYLLLCPPRDWLRRSVNLIPHAVVLSCYLTWRFTRGFGLAYGVLFPPREVHLDLALLLWNAKQLASWWMGPRLLDCFGDGLRSFTTMAPGHAAGLVLADIGAAFLVTRILRPKPENTSSFPDSRLVLFAIGWSLAGMALCLVAWTAGRFNFFAGVGVALLLSLVLSRMNTRAKIPLLFALSLVCLLSNQGIAKSWLDSSRFQRRLQNYIAATRDEWSGREILLIHTRELRERMLFPKSPTACAYFGQASLLRGFVPMSMARRVKPDTPPPEVILDTEWGARIEGDELWWHEHFDSSKPRRTPMNRVFVVNGWSDAGGDILTSRQDDDS